MELYDDPIVIGQLKYNTSNSVSTTKFNVITFVPKFFYEQLQNLINVFFLGIAIIQQVPQMSSLGQHGTAAPLCIILGVSAIKEIYEDVRRFLSDRQLNKRLVYAWSPKKGLWENQYWELLKVGHVVKVTKNSDVPADIIVLSSSEPAGMAYIETANLDGESSLKIRQALPVTSICISDALIEAFVASGSQLRCEPPNCHVYEFSGALDVAINFAPPANGGVAAGNYVTYSLTYGNLLPRGSRLKNTDWVYGVIAYAGKYTKLMQNSTRTPTKRSYVDSMLNLIMTAHFGILLTLCTVASVFNVYFIYTSHGGAWYIPYGTAPTSYESRMSLIIYFLRAMGLYNNFMPISVYVVLEMTRIIQAFFMENDLELYNEKTGVRAVARRSNLNETLGQVRFVLSDKTGTLTENKMIFKMCSIGGTRYGDRLTSHFQSKALLHDLKKGRKTAQCIRDFLIHLSVCHTVVPEKREDGEFKVSYHASSPDESALVKVASSLQFVFHTRTPDFVLVDIQDQTSRFDILSVLEFTSDRKRMGVVVRCPDGKIKLLIKGADSVILPRLASECDRNAIVNTLNHLRHFASLGYRTLCIGYRDISEAEYSKWEKDYFTACNAIENRREQVDAQAEIIEKDLILLGVTAIEDRLQEGVPATIQRLAESDIRTWVLTGDKLETAVNIGHSTTLIHQGMVTFVMQQATEQETTNDMIMRVTKEVQATVGVTLKRAALVIDGATLQKLITDGVSFEFVRLLLGAGCVICCRCTPKQKAAMVRFVHRHIDGATLAIGDGANDVAMIQAADVGIGINGEEGMQAAMAADYAITKFRHLQRLLFVHGTLSHARTTKALFFNFYKNTALVTLLALYVYFTGYSETPSMEPYCVICYNLFFTSWPTVAMGTLEQPAPLERLADDPNMYRLSQNRKTFSFPIHFWWQFEGFVHALIIFLVVTPFYSSEMIFSDGRVGGIYTYGTILFTTLVVVVNMRFLLDTTAINAVSLVVAIASLYWLQVFLYLEAILYPFVSTAEKSWDMVDAFWVILTTPSIGFAVLLATGMSLFVSFVPMAFNRVLSESKAQPKLIRWHGPVNEFLTPFSKLYRVFRPPKPGNMRQRTSYAFSQEDNGAVNQADLIRAYDSRRPKQPGTPIGRSAREVKIQESSISKAQEDSSEDVNKSHS